MSEGQRRKEVEASVLSSLVDEFFPFGKREQKSVTHKDAPWMRMKKGWAIDQECPLMEVPPHGNM